VPEKYKIPPLRKLSEFFYSFSTARHSLLLNFIEKKRALLAAAHSSGKKMQERFAET